MIFVRPSEIWCAAPCPGGRKSCVRPLPKSVRGVGKHRGQGQGERKFKCARHAQHPNQLQIRLRSASKSQPTLLPSAPAVAEGKALPPKLRRGLIEKHKSETWSEILDQLDQAEAASYDFGYKKARQELEEQIQFCYDQGYLQGVHEEKTRIHPALQAAHTLAWLVL